MQQSDKFLFTLIAHMHDWQKKEEDETRGERSSERKEEKSLFDVPQILNPLKHSSRVKPCEIPAMRTRDDDLLAHQAHILYFSSLKWHCCCCISIALPSKTTTAAFIPLLFLTCNKRRAVELISDALEIMKKAAEWKLQ